MSLYRSDDVSYYRLVIPRESAWDIMNRLGKFSFIQDNNNYYIYVHQKPLYWLVPSSITFVDVKMHSTDSKVSKNILMRKKFTNTRINFHRPHTTKSSDFGMINTLKQVGIQHQSSTIWSERLIMLGDIMKISLKELKF